METKTVPYSLWLALLDQYSAEGWRVRGYELHGPLSLPTHVDIERERGDFK
jgi:hypothetical protein